jgi:hypothetical protein
MSSRTVLMLVGLTIALQLFIGFKAMRSASALLQHRITQIEAIKP